MRRTAALPIPSGLPATLRLPAGGAAWDAGGDSAAAAAAAEAASGAWLAELDSGKLERLRAAAPGMKRGLFGGWAADAAQAGADGVAADEQLAAEVQAAEQQAADDAEQHQEQHQEQQQQQGPQKVSLDDLFRLVDSREMQRNSWQCGDGGAAASPHADRSRRRLHACMCMY
jgi:hypothetical protein